MSYRAATANGRCNTDSEAWPLDSANAISRSLVGNEFHDSAADRVLRALLADPVYEPSRISLRKPYDLYSVPVFGVLDNSGSPG